MWLARPALCYQKAVHLRRGVAHEMGACWLLLVAVRWSRLQATQKGQRDQACTRWHQILQSLLQGVRAKEHTIALCNTNARQDARCAVHLGL